MAPVQRAYLRRVNGKALRRLAETLTFDLATLPGRCG